MKTTQLETGNWIASKQLAPGQIVHSSPQPTERDAAAAKRLGLAETP